MPSVEGLAASGKLVQDNTDSIIRQNAAQQAADLFKNGDVKGALTTIARVDPDHAAQIMQQYQTQLDTNSIYNRAFAKSGGTTQAALPAQSNLLQQKLKGGLDLQALKNKQINPRDMVLTNDINSPSGKSLVNKKLGSMAQLSVGNLPQPSPDQSNAVADASGDQMSPQPTPKPNLRPNQDVDSNGQITTITPMQRKIIDGARKAFDTDAKDIIKGLESVDQANKLIDENVPGFEPLEKLRLLRSVSPRPSQQEFAAVGLDMGAITNLENKLSNLKGKGMTPEVQTLYKRVISVMQNSLMNEYDAKLKNAVERNPEVDPLVLKKRLAAGGPTVIQQLHQKIDKLSPEDQAAFNFAHDNPGDKRSKAILDHITSLLK